MGSVAWLILLERHLNLELRSPPWLRTPTSNACVRCMLAWMDGWVTEHLKRPLCLKRVSTGTDRNETISCRSPASMHQAPRSPLGALDSLILSLERALPRQDLLVLALGGLLRARLSTLFLIFFVRLGLFFILILVLVLIIELGVLGVLVPFVGQSLAGEPVNSTRDELFFNILTQLVIELESLFDVRGNLVIVGRCNRWCEEVEEGLSGNGLLNDASLLGIFISWSV